MEKKKSDMNLCIKKSVRLQKDKKEGLDGNL